MSTRMPHRRLSQRGIVMVSIDELRTLLGLPEGHEIERLTTSEYPYEPGLLVTLRGLSMPMAPASSPLVIEPYWSWRPDAEERADYARRMLMKDAKGTPP